MLSSVLMSVFWPKHIVDVLQLIEHSKKEGKHLDIGQSPVLMDAWYLRCLEVFYISEANDHSPDQ